MSKLSRRKWMGAGLAAGAGATGLAAAAGLAEAYGFVPPAHSGVYGPGETLTYASQRLLSRHTFAREFPRSAISAKPFPNSKPPADDQFKSLQAGGFADWRLEIDGMVANPGSFSLARLRSYPVTTQVTQLVCEEGWSFIAEWVGVPLSHVLHAAAILPQGRYVSYYSVEKDWYDSLDMADAMHPQTLITYGMNGDNLPVGHGGPLRLRVPRQLGYKSVKYLARISVTDKPAFSAASGYSWYAGI
jgi:DMSO/TMAO reductase YedYZ molybdopterin-dependent catalytic subunit